MQKAKVEKYRRQLMAMRDRLDQDLRHVEEVIVQENHHGDLSHLPTHNADRDIDGLDTELAIGRTETELLESVQQALRRIREGTFGKCTDCGRPIAEERLKVLPYVDACIGCERKRELAEGGEGRPHQPR